MEPPLSLVRNHLAAVAEAGLLFAGPFIAGSWHAASHAATFPVTDPASGTVVAEVARVGEGEAQEAVAAADAAADGWRRTSAKARAELLYRWSDALAALSEPLAALITLESGKPLAEARGEVAYAAAYFQWFGEQAKRINGMILPAPSPDREVLVKREPVGIVACITPWNFPIAMLARKLAPALAAGCTVVAKPSEETPLSAFAMVELGRRAGLPDGVVNILAGDAPAIGAVFTHSPLVRKLSFTGSTAVGVALQKDCAATMKRTSLELGGNAPFIVFADADLDRAVAGLMAAKFRNAGQTCICANRVLIEDSCFDAFVDRLRAAMARLRIGHGLDPETTLGPLINSPAAARVRALLKDVRAHRVMRFAEPPEESCFVAPALVIDPAPRQPLVDSEIFGPVMPLMRFSDEEEAMAMANDTPAGLAAYLYTADPRRQWRIPDRLAFGMIGVNDAALSNEMAPFGGIKMSGHGREGSVVGLDDYLEFKYLSIGDLA
jgi:succinate-semialdehyde dehydrogenase/glutarate-semialdehyde dehydrogenase